MSLAGAPPPIGREATRLLEATKELHSRLIALLNAPEELRESADRQRDRLTAAQAETRLETMPVTALKDIAGRGVRFGPLEQAGFRTVADVLHAQPYQLRSVPGVGDQTVRQVVRAARDTAVAMGRETRFRFDPDRQDLQQTALLATLAALRAADATRAEMGADITRFLRDTEPLVDVARKAGSRFSLFFARRAKKDAALEALTRLRHIMSAPWTQSFVDEVGKREWAIDRRAYDPAELWQNYHSQAASVNAVLSTVGPPLSVEDEDAAHGFIPDELRQQISAEPLDQSRLRPTTTLRGYQAFGAKYALHQQWSILGDEMGLGKTLQALAALGHLAANGQRRFLVVCPASVQVNWQNEIVKHTLLDVHSLHGADRNAAGRRWLREGGVAVTTFRTLDALAPEVREAEVAMLVVDEAHYVKNPNAMRSKAVRAAIKSAQRALFLTGTPMENRVEEFRTLVGYLQPKVALRVQAHDALAGARAFRRGVAEVYLRRNQEDVLTELPEKIEIESWVQPTEADLDAYVQAAGNRNLMGMRQAMISSLRSAKLERLREIVEEAEEDGRKVVVFSYFLEALALAERTLAEPSLNVAVVGRIDGQVPPAVRQQIIDEFSGRPDCAVLLAQIEAGGVGLNIQAASVVVLMEPQWKPSTEEQAIARAHRMGQTLPVSVHRLLAKDSIDERIREIQEDKRLLFDAFARESEAKEADPRAVDRSDHRPEALDDASIPVTQRVLLAERYRLGF